jgi:hypothetical protein
LFFVRFMHDFPEPVGRAEPGDGGHARQFFDLSVDRVEGKICALAEENAGPTLDDVGQLGRGRAIQEIPGRNRVAARGTSGLFCFHG